MYSDLQSQIESLGGDLKAKVNVALEDGVITLDEQTEITNLQIKIADITNQISQAETEASFQSLKNQIPPGHHWMLTLSLLWCLKFRQMYRKRRHNMMRHYRFL